MTALQQIAQRVRARARPQRRPATFMARRQAWLGIVLGLLFGGIGLATAALLFGHV